MPARIRNLALAARGQQESGGTVYPLKFSLTCRILLLLAALTVVACDDGGEMDQPDAEQRAEKLAQELIIVDTHIDAPYRLTEEDVRLGVPTLGRLTAGDLELGALKLGRLGAL